MDGATGTKLGDIWAGWMTNRVGLVMSRDWTGRLFLIFGYNLKEFLVLFDLHALCGISGILLHKIIPGSVNGYRPSLMAKVLGNEFVIGTVVITLIWFPSCIVLKVYTNYKKNKFGRTRNLLIIPSFYKLVYKIGNIF